MVKSEIIQAIVRLNRTARLEFLAEFSEPELLDYLEHLQSVSDLPRPEPMHSEALVA